ncbi:MAG: hypothetical protein ABSD71_12295 [Bacteroidales bacterium]|jgi:hypothetical protein
MKKMVSLLLTFMMSSSLMFSQNNLTTPSAITKTSPSPLTNEFYAGYGGLSVFYFSGQLVTSFNQSYSINSFTDPTSFGNIYIGYNRHLNKVVSTGFMFGYQDFQSTATGETGDYDAYTKFPVTIDDRLLMAIARVSFCYVDKPVVHMYSGVGIGVTMDFATARGNGESSTDRKLFPAGQLTLMGIRFGRAFGGFFEFGIGTYGILNAGLSYKFAD